MTAATTRRFSARNLTLIALATLIAATSIQPAQAFGFNFGNGGGGLRDENGKKCMSKKQVKREYQAGGYYTDIQVRDGDRKGTAVVYFTGTVGNYENIRWEQVYDLCKREPISLRPA
jgi:hypothetical protein